MTRKYVSPQIEMIKIRLSGCLAVSPGGIPKEEDNLNPDFVEAPSPFFNPLFDLYGNPLKFDPLQNQYPDYR